MLIQHHFKDADSAAPLPGLNHKYFIFAHLPKLP